MKAKKMLVLLMALLICVFVFSSCIEDNYNGVKFTAHNYDSSARWKRDYGETLLLNSYEAFEEFRAEALKNYNEYVETYYKGEHNYKDAYDNFISQLKTYDAKYFETSILIIAHQTEGSGSIKVSVKRLQYNEAEAVVTLERQVPQMGTDDMRYWSFIIECKKSSDLTHASLEIINVEQ